MIATASFPSNGLCRADETVLPDMAKRLQAAKPRRSTSITDLITAYPNPTDGPVYLVYKVLEGVEQVEMRVVDAMGRLILRERAPPKNGILEVPLAQLATGAHIASLYFDGIAVGSVTVQVVR